MSGELCWISPRHSITALGLTWNIVESTFCDYCIDCIGELHLNSFRGCWINAEWLLNVNLIICTIMNSFMKNLTLLTYCTICSVYMRKNHKQALYNSKYCSNLISIFLFRNWQISWWRTLTWDLAALSSKLFVEIT